MSSEHSLDDVAARLSTLIEALPDAIFFKDGAGRWRVVNSAGLQLFGLADCDWQGKTDLELAALYPDLANVYTTCHHDDEKAWAHGARLDTVEYVPAPGGSEIHTFEVTKLPLFHPDGSRRGLVVIGRDVTARVRADEAAIRQRASLRRLSEIAALSHLPLADQLRQALNVGAVHLGLEFGIVSHIEGEQYRVVAQVSPPDMLSDDQIFSLGQTYCSLTIAQNSVVAVESIGDAPHRGHPCYRNSGLGAYIAAPVFVDNKVYGTVNFSSPRPYGRRFDENDREFVQLLARWAGSAVERDRTERRLAESELQLRTIIETEPECVKVLAEDGTLLQMNRAGLEMIGADSVEQVIGQSVDPMVTPEYRQAFDDLTHRVFRGKSGRLEFEIINLKGAHLWLETNAVPLRDSSGDITALLSVTRDISERKAAEAEIHRLAFYDPLTQLANRRLLLDRIRQAFHTSVRRDNYGAVMFIDLDNFKMLNDTMGHDVGDQLLIEMARRLVSAVRAEDTVARLGGDEFVVMLQYLGQEKSLAADRVGRVGEKIRALLSRPYILGEHEYQTTPSIGVSLFYGDDQTPDELLKHADVALYCAKNAGRNRVCFFDPAMQAAIDTRAELEADLQRALREDEFALYYQLQVGCDNDVTCAEALLRWHSPKRGVVAPGDFIPLAEETGLIVPIGYWVLETACRKLKEWEADPLTRELELSVNVSSRQFHQADFVDRVGKLLLKTAIDPSRLKLELTESLVLNNVDDAVEKMQALRALGVGLSIDDFGTGFASLSYLVRLPFEQLKIDQSFIRDMTTTGANAIVVESIINMAHSLGLDVIAEGVETEEQHALLSRHGCPSFQGFLFGRPVPATEFEQALHARNG